MDKVKLNGMGGSNSGKNRCEGTEILKARSTKKRRKQSRMDSVAAGLGLTKVRGALGGVYYE